MAKQSIRTSLPETEAPKRIGCKKRNPPRLFKVTYTCPHHDDKAADRFLRTLGGIISRKISELLDKDDESSAVGLGRSDRNGD
ncbi:MAG: hypothetical protein AB1411_02395 [Nitrospirota bacterium]